MCADYGVCKHFGPVETTIKWSRFSGKLAAYGNLMPRYLLCIKFLFFDFFFRWIFSWESVLITLKNCQAWNKILIKQFKQYISIPHHPQNNFWEISANFHPIISMLHVKLTSLTNKPAHSLFFIAKHES